MNELQVRRGRPSASEIARVEMTARAQEAAALVAALRYTAGDLERLAWSVEGDPRVAHYAGRLRGMADQVERRWERVS